jgi:uncharacterized protein DUF488
LDEAFARNELAAEFATALDELQTLARDRPTAIMCAEGQWWRCHRRQIADRLVVAGRTVCHVAPDDTLRARAAAVRERQADDNRAYTPELRDRCSAREAAYPGADTGAVDWMRLRTSRSATGSVVRS